MLALFLPILCFGEEIYQQVHLAYSDSPYSLKAMWLTFQPTPSSDLHLCSFNVCKLLEGTQTLYIFNDEEKIGESSIHRYLHKVEIKDLIPTQLYSYQVGSVANRTWSRAYRFNGPKMGFESPYSSAADFVVFGDFGTCSSMSNPTLNSLIKSAQSLKYDFFLHIGDFAYNLNTDNGRRGDDFLSDIEGIAAYVPYMTAVGNHERYQNYTHYRNLFDMPGNTDGFYYSFNVGPVHVIVYSSETACKHPYCPDELQLAWLAADLAQAKQNRHKQPWIIAASHEPLYCSVDWNDRSEYQNCVVNAEIRRAFYEDLFANYELDVHFHGHIHNYERTEPVLHAASQPSLISASHLYVNPTAPIYVISGIAGSCLEDDVAYSSSTPDPYSMFRTDELSYTRVHAEERLLRVEQVSSITEEVIDYFFVAKVDLQTVK